MRQSKSERLKKLETELEDLKQWLKLSLVPKKDIEKHKEEMQVIQAKIDEERERLQFLRESGEGEDQQSIKRGTPRPAYAEMPTVPDIDLPDTVAGLPGESQFDLDEESEDFEASAEYEEENEEGAPESEELEDEDSYFSDTNRWRRGGIMDPDADDW